MCRLNFGMAFVCALSITCGVAVPAAVHAAPYSTEVLASGPVGYWHLGEAAGPTAANSGTAGALLNATYSNYAGTRPGLVSDSTFASDFNGVQTAAGTYLTGSGLNSVSGGNPFSGNWTIEGWLVRDAVRQWSGVFSNNAASPFQAPLMTFIDNTHRLGFNGAGFTAAGASIDLNSANYLGKPVYAVVTKTGPNTSSGAAITVYANVDGEWLTPATGTNPGYSLMTYDGFFIGRHASSLNQQHDGALDELAIYNRALSPAEIQAHYSASGAAQLNTLATAPLIVDDGDAGYSFPLGSSGTRTERVFNDQMSGNNDAALARWNAPRAGEQVVQVHWLTHSLHESTAQYIVDLDGNIATTGDQTITTVNQKQTAAQGASGSVPAITESASGWYTLGTFPLTSSSAIFVRKAAGDGATEYIAADAVRFGVRDTLIDELSSRVQVAGAGWTNATAYSASGDPNSQMYAYTSTPSATLDYIPAMEGFYDIQISWGVFNGSAHTTDARWLLDLDGNFTTTNDQFTLADGINQNRYNDQSTAGIGTADWSGFLDVGNFSLTSTSRIRLFNDAGTGALAADVLRLVQQDVALLPEPSAWATFALCGGALSFLFWRRGKRRARTAG